MTKIAIVQARMSSERLPGKVIADLCGKPVIQNIVERLRKSNMLDEIIIATSDTKSDDIIEEICYKNNIQVFRGNLDNVLERFYQCASIYGADIIVRCTADNPFVDAGIIDDAVAMFMSKKLDYLSYKKKLPLGMGIEVFNFNALKKSYFETNNKECLEHVTPYIIMNPHIFNTLTFLDEQDPDYSFMRFTMDTHEDYEFASKVYNFFGSNEFTYDQLLRTVLMYPDWLEINRSVKQNTLNYKGEKKDDFI